MDGVAKRVTGWTQAEAAGRSVDEVFVRQDGPPAAPAASPVDTLLAREAVAATCRRWCACRAAAAGRSSICAKR